MARSLLAASQEQAENPLFNGAKIAIAQFYAEHVLPHAVALKASIVSANVNAGVLALSEDQFRGWLR